jgi:lipoprotein-anchoring transpeptidase ErfK/SrfK
MRMTETKAKLAGRVKGLVLLIVLAASAASAQRAGTAGKRQILVSIPDRKLALLEDGRVIKVYPVAVGAKVSPSPTGRFAVVNRVVKPTYFHAGTVIEPGPRNPLGTRWIGLSQKGYGIHGTNAPRSIGKAASHGCIRMAKADLEELFEMVRPGDVVEIRGAADQETAEIFGTVTVAEAQTGAGIGGSR